MRGLSLSQAWEETRRIFARDGGLLSAVALALLVLPQIIAGIVAPISDRADASTRIVELIAAFIGIIGQLAIVRLTLGPSTTVREAIGHGFRRFPAILGSLLILMCAIILALVPIMGALMATGMIDLDAGGTAPSPAFATLVVLLLIVSLFAAVKFIMTVPVASAEEAGPLTILKRSWKLTRGHYWPLFGLELLLLVAALALLSAAQFVGGSLAQIVGRVEPFSLSALILAAFVAAAQAAFTVLATVMLVRIYVQLAGGPEARAGVPSTGV